ncbi:LAMI_0A08174g1_1 [Lachancea mirantina]|uniref:LSM2-LSM8 complex subunit LSM8 n=1 Tax=Lachancea mirantina TaxID=1230905 RepID=A0A1G4IRA5_9SACH|nr:LAMI_0A08174g1_1 [Lachancea mirantina]
MSPLLKDFLNTRVVVITTEGQCFVATLEGFDKNTNLVLSDVRDRVSQQEIASCYFLRGSQVVCCGPLDSGGKESVDLHDLGNDRNSLELRDTLNRVADEHLIWGKVWQSKEARTSI